IGRSAEDVNQVFEFIHGFDPRDPTTVGLAYDEQLADVRGWKVGVPKGAFDGDGAICKSVLDELKKLGVETVEVELPDYPLDAMLLILTAEAGAAFDDFSRGDKDDQMARQS